MGDSTMTVTQIVEAVTRFDEAMLGKPNTLPFRILAMCAVLGVELYGHDGQDEKGHGANDAGAIPRGRTTD